MSSATKATCISKLPAQSIYKFQTLTASMNFCMLLPFLCTDRALLVSADVAFPHWSTSVVTVECDRPALLKNSKI